VNASTNLTISEIYKTEENIAKNSNKKLDTDTFILDDKSKTDPSVKQRGSANILRKSENIAMI